MSDREFSGSSESAQAFLPGLAGFAPIFQVPDWRAKAFAALALFVKAHPGRRFLIEEFRASLPEGFPQPREPRSWGTVVQDAARQGLISRVGYRNARSSNLSPKPEWEALS